MTLNAYGLELLFESLNFHVTIDIDFARKGVGVALVNENENGVLGDFKDIRLYWDLDGLSSRTGNPQTKVCCEDARACESNHEGTQSNHTSHNASGNAKNRFGA